MLRHQAWLLAQSKALVVCCLSDLPFLQTISRPTWALDRLCLLTQQAQCDIPSVHGMERTKTQRMIKGWKMSSNDLSNFLALSSILSHILSLFIALRSLLFSSQRFFYQFCVLVTSLFSFYHQNEGITNWYSYCASRCCR